MNGKKLTDAQELGLCLHIDKMDDIGFPLLLEALEASANSILARSCSSGSTPVEPVGETWVERFLKRYPGYQERAQ